MRRFGHVFASAFVWVLLLVAAGTARAAATYPLHADPAWRTLVGANGQPFVLVGDAAWSLIVQLNQTEVQQYLDDRKARGFNAVLVNLIEHKFATAAPADHYGQQPFLVAGDISTPNDAYFANAEWVVAQAAQRGMLVLLAPMYLGYQGSDQGWYQELKASGTTKAQAYGRYVGERFAKYPNIVWVHGGDMPPTDVLPQIEALVAGIKAFDTTHPQTAHSQRGDSSLDDYDRPWLDVNSVYTDCSTVQSKSRIEYQRAQPLPFVHIEGIYENEGATAECLLDQAYYPVLLGGRGHVFGNNPIWFFGAGWPTQLASTGSRLAQYAGALFVSREGGTLVPDIAGRTVVGGAGTPGAPGYAQAARTASGTSVLVYVPSARTITLDTTYVPSPSYVGWWYDPRSGSTQKIGQFTAGGLANFTTPAGGPWLLVLDDASAALGAPGTPVTAAPPAPTLRSSDLIWRNQNGALAAWVMSGVAAQSYLSFNPGMVADAHWLMRAAADFNLDGQLDLLWQNDSTGDLAIWYMNGLNAVSFVSLAPGRLADPRWQIRGVGDFNGDGRPDLLFHHSATGDLVVWYMNGATAIGFTAVSPSRVDPSWQVQGVADLNGDGRPDIVWQHSTGQIAAWLMNGVAVASYVGVNPGRVDPAWQLRRVVDMNADGRPDFVWRKTTTGDMAVWYMSGTSAFGFVPLNPSPVSTQWELMR